MSGRRIEPVVPISISSRLRERSVQGPESDAPTLATLACPAGPEDEPVRRPMLGGSGPSVARVEAAGNVPNRCSYNQPFRITGRFVAVLMEPSA
jgi:hypothetical protein